MSTRAPFLTHGDVHIGGTVGGEGPRVLLLHGGPGLGDDHFAELLDELDDYTVAFHQQRGVEPSQMEGPFTVADHVADALRVLDHLGWEAVTVVGHSWGGHLALHLAVAAPERLDGVLCIDTLGAVGDGGMGQFGAELMARTPPELQQQYAAHEAELAAGRVEPGHELDGLALIWPAYFPSWDSAPPSLARKASVPCSEETFASLAAELPGLETALPEVAVPVGFVVGARSPMPATASTDTADRIPGAWVEVVEGAGHFVWLDRPGIVRAALDRLVTGTETPSSGGRAEK